MRPYSILIILFALTNSLSQPLQCQDSKERVNTHVLELLVGNDQPIPVNFKIGQVIDKRENTSDTLSIWKRNNRKEVFLINWNLSESIFNYSSRAFESLPDSHTYNLEINAVAIFPKQLYNGLAQIMVSFVDPESNETVMTLATWEDRVIVNEPGDERYLLNSVLSKAAVNFHLFLNSNGYNSSNETIGAGFYLSSKDYLNGMPAFDLPVNIEVIKKRNKETQAYTIKTQDENIYNSNLGDLVFAYSDGENLYYSSRNYHNTTSFSKAVFYDKDYIIFYHEKTPADASLVAGTTAVGLILGVLTGVYIIPIFKNYQGLAIHDLKNNVVFPGSLEEFRVRVRKNPKSPKALKRISPVEFKRDPVYYWTNFLKLQ